MIGRMMQGVEEMLLVLFHQIHGAHLGHDLFSLSMTGVRTAA
jgi:hypothetical protein